MTNCGLIGLDATTEALYARLEATYLEGGANAQLLTVPFENHSLQANPVFEQNPLIFPGRQRGLDRKVGGNAGGDITSRLSFAEPFFELAMEAGFFSNVGFAAQPEVGYIQGGTPAADITFSSTTVNQVTLTSSDPTTWANILVDDVLSFRGTTGGVDDAILFNNRVAVVTAKASDQEITVTVPDDLWALIAPTNLPGEVAGSLVTAVGATIGRPSYVQNGTQCCSIYLERQNDQVPNQHISYPGGVVGTFGINVQLRQSLTVALNFLASEEQPDLLLATDGDGAPQAAAGETLVGAVDTIRVIENGSRTARLRSFNFSLGNNLRERENIGTSGAVSIGSDVPTIGGAGQEDPTDFGLLARFNQDVETDFLWEIRDVQNRAYILQTPAARFSEMSLPNGGQGNDLLYNYSWTAGLGSGKTFMARLYRIPSTAP